MSSDPFQNEQSDSIPIIGTSSDDMVNTLSRDNEKSGSSGSNEDVILFATPELTKKESGTLEDISPVLSVASESLCVEQKELLKQESKEDSVSIIDSSSGKQEAESVESEDNSYHLKNEIGRQDVIEIPSVSGMEIIQQTNQFDQTTDTNIDAIEGTKQCTKEEATEEVIINEDSSQSSEGNLVAEPILITNIESSDKPTGDEVVDLTAESCDMVADCISLDSNEDEEIQEPDMKRRRVESEVIELSEESQEVEFVSAENSTRSVYSFKDRPKQLTGAWECYRNKDNSNFLKGCKWAPDGTCLMTSSDDNVIRVFNLPNELYHQGGEDSNIQEMVPVLTMKEADTIYDYCWYPLMSSANPDTACLVVTSKDTPIHMYDAFTGDIRCSYRAYDHLDEIAPAHCVSFDVFGNKLFCGFNKMIRVFDVTRPGRDFQKRPTFAKEGQRGIISCIAHSPAEHGLYAAGSYSRSIALYQDRNKGEMLCMFEGQQGGVTQLLFSPDGTKLYSGGRKDNEILCWDLRNPGHILYTMIRNVQTNQRMYMDITSDGGYVVSGSHDGKVLVWDTTQSPEIPGPNMDPVLQPTLTFPAHTDTVNGVSLHPTIPVIATASGQRHYPGYRGNSDASSGSDDDDGDNIDNSLKLWWMYQNNT